MTAIPINFFKLSILYFKFYFTGTLRNIPSFFFTLIFPPLIFILSFHVWGRDPIAQRSTYLTFVNYSVQTVCFMLLGMNVSQEKHSNWAQYVRTLPAPIAVMIIGRILHTVTIAFINMVILTSIAIFIFLIPFSFLQILSIFLICSFGAIPFALMGISIGSFANQESARSIFTICNLLFLFGSFGLSTSGIFYHFQKFILTYQWLTLQKSIFDPNISIIFPMMIIAGYTIVFSFVSSLSLRHERQ